MDFFAITPKVFGVIKVCEALIIVSEDMIKAVFFGAIVVAWTTLHAPFANHRCLIAGILKQPSNSYGRYSIAHGKIGDMFSRHENLP